MCNVSFYLTRLIVIIVVSVVVCSIEAVDNAAMFPDDQDHINYDTNVIYVCNDGHVMIESENAIRTCQADKALSRDPPVCTSRFLQ